MDCSSCVVVVSTYLKCLLIEMKNFARLGNCGSHLKYLLQYNLYKISFSSNHIIVLKMMSL